MTQPSILLAGCGDIAQRLALLLHHDFRLTGLRRQAHDLPAYITPLAADICDPAALQQAIGDQCFDYVVITLTPGERTETRYRQIYVDGTRNLLANLTGKPRLLFVSSTSVYAQDAGETVDEHSPALGNGFSGRCLLEAEALVRNSGFASTCIRFSGIYGPGRERLVRMVRELRVDPADAYQFSNRIHADDCARVLAFLIECWEDDISPSPVYVASDTQPVQSGYVWQWLGHILEVDDPLPDNNWQQLPPTGKRCDSKLLQSTGFQFLYPDFKSGYCLQR
ncbi:MAG TPA: NAD(P)H-binding protein [Pseudomonadales bacterium]|nr:NAD(P)H-binding protein [Pseudomonadales bacterium]